MPVKTLTPTSDLSNFDFVADYRDTLNHLYGSICGTKANIDLANTLLLAMRLMDARVEHLIQQKETNANPRN